MKILLLFMLLAGSNVQAGTTSIKKENEFLKTPQSYLIDNVLVEDSEILNNILLRNHDIVVESEPRSDYNIVSKNLSNGVTNFIDFDEEYYTFRQYAFDTESTRSDMNIRNAGLNFETKSINYGNSTVICTEGFNPNSEYIRNENNRIIGDDDRQQVSDTTIFPYQSCGYILVRFDVVNNITSNIDSRYFASTGFLEGPDLLVTAGHVMYSDVTTSFYDDNNVLHEEYDDYTNNPRFPDEIRYYPAQNSPDFRPFGYVTVERVYIEKSYYLTQQKDWACCKLSTAIGYQTGWLGKAANFYEYNYPFESFGYPGSKSGYMYHANANFTYFETDTRNYRTNLDSEGGQSGSPYQITLNGIGYVSGIHNYSFGDLYSGGIRIDNFMFSFMNSFVTGNYFTQTIIPTDYGFQDAYPTSEYYQSTYVSSYVDDFRFMTRRYRTGYIHNEYIVMSPIRTGITEAYIEYRFLIPVKRIEVQLSHWRSPSLELLTPTSGEAFLQTPASAYSWNDEFDLLNDITLPIDRTNPETFAFTFDEPLYRFRFYSRIFSPISSDANRGRICIGDMTIWSPNYTDFLPLSGYENLYDYLNWGDPIRSNSNCYAYAICNQVYPGTNNLWFKQQPGEYANVSCFPFTKQNLVTAVQADFAKYNLDYNLNLTFQEVSKDTICPAGTYKVALVAYPGDYHWYRQDADGYWSHKPGTTPVTNLDESGDLITDPAFADRGNYTNFLGYFAVTPWGNYYA